MKNYQLKFIQFLIENNVLSFGTFILKSGRKSPYFFNAGALSSGVAMSELGNFYADALIDAGLAYDVLFGPAYKGIPLVTALAISLAQRHIDAKFAFNRKELKDHGEGGSIVGSSLENSRVFVIDDVITAGIVPAHHVGGAICESVALIKASGGSICGVIVALDRQEISNTEGKSAIAQVESEFSVPVLSIVKFEHVLEFLETGNSGAQKYQQYLPLMKEYRKMYGVV